MPLPPVGRVPLNVVRLVLPPQVTVESTVLIILFAMAGVDDGLNFLTTLFFTSATYTLPLASTARPPGPFSWAVAGAPPSPLYPAAPVPATVVAVKVTGAISSTVDDVESDT